ncbi:hypothetical protein TWF102_007457 [Orbilia oligospora]|uniref:Nephrocystin 3-like N-terminal domain-containing protein n=1 Tax=Orbilia oligospora TaxID=2813651 RepID=A0A7C8N674_ORBOL|nr:hypothetical protein TWF102_007457 [Orbilia oligospora]
MATSKNRGTYRALVIDTGTTEIQFTKALERKLRKGEEYTFDVRLAPDCISPGTFQIAVIRVEPFSSEAPLFLKDGKAYFKLGQTEIRIEADFLGLTQLYPVAGGEAEIDIVALSGLNSHAYGSWISPESDGSRPMWLQDFLSKHENLKYCRTMIFGYDTKYNANKKIFGGMFVAHAYVKTSGARDGDHKDIYDSVASLFFFGVPFSGIYLDDVLSMFKDKEKFPTHDQYDGIEITRQGPDLVKGIKYEARSSSIAITAFMDNVAENGVYVYSFYETDRTPMVAKLKNGQYGRSGKDVLVVSRDSALLKIAGLAELIAAQGDHSTIVKLKSLQDETAPFLELDQADLEKMTYAEDAAFDSCDDAKCHPKTRQELLNQIKEWAEDPKGECIFWLSGQAGTGKSTISRTVADIFNNCKRLGASFFFKGGENKRDNASLLFTTISVQLSRRLPGLVPYIKRAIQGDRDIIRKSFQKQFKYLVLQPLQELGRKAIST